MIGVAVFATAIVAGYVLLVLVIGVALSGILSPTPYVYFVDPSPDRSMSRVTRVNFGGGATVSAVSDVYLVGADFDERVEIGWYDHGGPTALDGWRGNRAINVCMLRYPLNQDMPPVKPSVLAKSVGGQSTQVRVSWDCPTEVLRDRAGQER